MKLTFPYEKKQSVVFEKIFRPVAKVRFWSIRYQRWLEYTMIVDTGADYTVLPFSSAYDLGIDPEKDCQIFSSSGIGGKEIVYFSKKKVKITISDWQMDIPVGFLGRDNIPPLLGREGCLNKLKLLFASLTTTFEV